MCALRVPPARVVFPKNDVPSILSDIEEALGSGALTLGQHTAALESEFSEYTEADHSIAVNSGTASLEIPLRAWGVVGREVIVPTNTFFATGAAVVHAGGIPKFADVDAETLSLSEEAFEEAVGPNTAAVIIVHIAGIVTPWIARLRQLCDQKGIKLLEDAAHAHGSAHDGKFAGTFGHAGSFSFYPTKVITSGEGGIITTEDSELDRLARGYRDQGKVDFTSNFHTLMGYNWRMSELHAILGRHQLRQLDDAVEHRTRIASIYDKALANVERVSAIKIPVGGRSSYYKYVALLDSGIDRAELKTTLRGNYDVGLAGEVYDTALHEQPVFAEWAGGTFRNAEDICARQICLPIFNNMSEDDAIYVVESLDNVINSI
jgi:perosamine synthetase